MADKEPKIKIDKRIEHNVEPLSKEDYEALKESIKNNGLLKPIDIMEDGTIIDGHHRYKICKELGVKPLFAMMPNVRTIEIAL